VDTISGAQVEATSEAVDELADKAEDSRPSVLIPILKVLVDASTAFTPLHSAASGLLKVVDIFEVRHCSFLVAQSHLLPACAGQKTAVNKRDIAALLISLSNLVTTLQGPLKSPDRCPPALQQRINTLSRSHFVTASLSSPVVSDTMRNDSSVDEINGALERIKQQQTLAGALRADGNEAKISACVQMLKQHIDSFMVSDHLVIYYLSSS